MLLRAYLGEQNSSKEFRRRTPLSAANLANFGTRVARRTTRDVTTGNSVALAEIAELMLGLVAI